MANNKITKASRATHSKSTAASLPFLASAEVIDPALASLFEASTIPVNPKRQSLAAVSSHTRVEQDSVPLSGNEDEYGNSPATPDDFQNTDPGSRTQGHSAKRKRKRKEIDEDEDLEDIYMRRQERDGVREEKRRQLERMKDQNTVPTSGVSGGVALPLEDGSYGSDNGREGNERDEESAVRGGESDNDHSRSDDDAAGSSGSMSSQESGGHDDVIQHESLAPSRESLELEKSSRTVFLANVSTLAITTKSAKKALMNHLTSFVPSLPADSVGHGLESLRFRSVAFTSSAVPKKAAFAKKELMDATTKSTNAYAVYSTTLAAREAVKKLNGTVILDRHLRVDSVAHPARTDHRRCVFVGNLGFVDDESLMNASEELNGDKRPRKVKEPSDIEEGLWRQFEKAGRVESVRVVRDQQTRVGKGIAYVQFMDPNGVEAALLFNEKKYPPLLPRKLRVTRARSIKKPSTLSNTNTSKQPYLNNNSSRVYNPKGNPQVRSLQGRAGKLLGRAGAAQFKALSNTNTGNDRGLRNVVKTPESVVFEGYRASSRNGKEGMKMGGSGKKKGKPRSRSSKRGAAWKKSKGKKAVQ